MIIDSRTRVEEIPRFSVSVEDAGLLATTRDQGVASGLAFVGHSTIPYPSAAMDMAARKPNVDSETSGMPMHSKVREAVERVGDHRVFYGSVTPFHHPSVELARVRVSGRSTELTDRVFVADSQALSFGDAPLADVA